MFFNMQKNYETINQICVFANKTSTHINTFTLKQYIIMLNMTCHIHPMLKKRIIATQDGVT